MTKRRLSSPAIASQARKEPSVGLILGCALATGVALGVAYDGKAYNHGHLTSFANVGLGLPESWTNMAIPPKVLASIKLDAWPSWLTDAKTADTRPEIAIVIDDLGVDEGRTKEAIALPAGVTLSFLPYADATHDLSHEAHIAGHQVMVHLSMQPVGGADPGPNALRVSLPPAEIARRVDWALERVSDYEGVNNHMGSRFTASRSALKPAMQELASRKVFFLDSRTTAKTQAESAAREAGMLSGARDIFLDDETAASAVDRQLARVEAKAREQGSAIAIGHPHRQTLTALKTWTASLEKKGFRLVPVKQVLEDRGRAEQPALLSKLFK